MNVRSCVLVVVVAMALWVIPSTVSAMDQVGTSGSRPVVTGVTAQEREAIRQTPLLERPNRPGHFYGNTVRWLHDRRTPRGG